MTTKDLRDIAAYVGCAFTYEEIWPTADGKAEEWRKRKSSGYLLLSALVMVAIAQDHNVPLGIQNLKLHLRPFASLTDEEFAQAKALVGPIIERSVNKVLIASYAPELIAYLQSIGVYVPGTIAENFVSLHP